MRRVAVLSDPHGDLIALEKVITDLASTGPFDEVILGGDLAQGGAQPAQTVDAIRSRGWRAVRGNSDDLLVRLAGGMNPEEALRAAAATRETLPEDLVGRARWSIDRLGPERIAYLRALPPSIELGAFPFGRALLVHATPWSNEDVVHPDAGEELAARMVRESGARLVVYGHIHTPYQRGVEGGFLVSVGAVTGSNDSDPRPAYTILNLSDTISVEVRRVDWPAHERLAAFQAAGLEARFARSDPGPLPVRSKPGVVVTLFAGDHG